MRWREDETRRTHGGIGYLNTKRGCKKTSRQCEPPEDHEKARRDKIPAEVAKDQKAMRDTQCHP